jgi:LysR family hydrogen peroxide-inducible transcriptional activator
VFLTETGERIVAQARRALAEADRVRQMAIQGRDPLKGTLRLGIIHTIAPYLLPELVSVLRRTAPEMPLDVEENITATLDRMLRAGELDAVILALPYEGPGIDVLPLYEESFRVVMPARHPFARRKSVAIEDLDAGELLLLPVGHCFRDQVLEACTEFSRPPEPGRQGNSLETLRSMVASGLGVSVLPATALTARHASALVKAVPFTNPQPSRRVVLASRHGFHRSGALAKLVEAVRELDLPVTRLQA